MYPQSNGFAESMVKVMKNLITKSVESNEDPNWAMQAYRATPLSASLPSPAEMLHGRPLRTNIPSSRPSAQNDDTLESQHRRQQKGGMFNYDLTLYICHIINSLEFMSPCTRFVTPQYKVEY